jgi:S-adenosylmethionine:tRNA ribosyltransferase-isomerase
MKLRSYLKLFNYPLPQKLIAQKLAKPRDKAKLLVYNRETGKVFHDIFLNLDKYLPEKSLIIFNQTKVIPARLYAKKQTGGRTEIFYLGRDSSLIKAMLSPGVKIGAKLFLNKDYWFEAVSKKEKIFYLKPNFPIAKVSEVLDKFGRTPIPPYIKSTPLSEKELRKQYQTVFAKILESVAAPTASLHFTHRLLKKLKNKGHQLGFINLNVNLGTFAPLEQKHLKSKKLYQEEFFIPEQTIELIKKAKRHHWTIIACGTTVARALESSQTLKRPASKWETTDLFIQPGYKFKIIDGLITNFHLPQSSLLILVSAFVGRERALELYEKAIAREYRFYSFGDGMLII